jgi:hypothetical protein
MGRMPGAMSWPKWRIAATAAALTFPLSYAQSFPSANIGNSLISVDLYLPDAENGSYRATRFDWSGIIRNLTYKGHSYFGQWYEKHDPLVHDAITGPVNVFSSAIGYVEAKAGETFVRIGVGRVEKPDELAYSETRAYRVVGAGKWTISRKAASIRFTQELPDNGGRRGYGYVYTKEISLEPGRPEMVLSQELRNTGAKALDTSVYNHGFFQIDHEPAGPELVWTFPFEPHPSGDFGGMAAVEGHEVRYLRDVKPGERVVAALTGYSTLSSDHAFSLENRRTGAGVRVAGDRPITKLTFWSRRDAYSPEASIQLHIPPGETARWQTTYTFYTAGGDK